MCTLYYGQLSQYSHHYMSGGAAPPSSSPSESIGVRRGVRRASPTNTFPCFPSTVVVNQLSLLHEEGSIAPTAASVCSCAPEGEQLSTSLSKDVCSLEAFIFQVFFLSVPVWTVRRFALSTFPFSKKGGQWSLRWQLHCFNNSSKKIVVGAVS